MKKILIIGSGGAGKSTLARELGNILGLEVIHLDTCYLNSGWVETPKAEWQSIVQELVPQGGSQKSKVKSQKYYGMGFLGILNGCSIYAVAY
jgi:adenylate kinase family enzyme